jgi:hypothetical protein
MQVELTAKGVCPVGGVDKGVELGYTLNIDIRRAWDE